MISINSLQAVLSIETETYKPQNCLPCFILLFWLLPSQEYDPTIGEDYRKQILWFCQLNGIATFFNILNFYQFLFVQAFSCKLFIVKVFDVFFCGDQGWSVFPLVHEIIRSLLLYLG